MDNKQISQSDLYELEYVLSHLQTLSYREKDPSISSELNQLIFTLQRIVTSLR